MENLLLILGWVGVITFTFAMIWLAWMFWKIGKD